MTASTRPTGQARRLANASTRIEAPRDRRGRFVPVVPAGAPDLPAAMRRSGVPGALHAVPLPAPVWIGATEFTAADCGPHAASIGAALAAEWAAARTETGDPR